MSDARVGEGVPPPVITVVQRGQITEVAHRGDVAVVADGGRLAASVGEPDRLISLRSAVKPFTTVAVLAAADEAGLTLDDEMIALASASHAGADEHTAVAQRMVDIFGLNPAHLVHGRPQSSRGGSGDLLAHMCSGQHLSLLLLAKARGFDPIGYDAFDHPVQRELRTVVGELLSVDLHAAPWGIDGCAIPTSAVPLRAAAEGARRWATPHDPLVPERYRALLERVRIAAVKNPRLISGAGSLDTDLIRGGEGLVVAKQGAEGLCLIGLPGYGIAVRTEDGDAAARSGRVATVAVLAAIGASVAAASSLEAHRIVNLADPRGGAALATVSPAASLSMLEVS
ncbi:MAG: asparaginase [Chloroflexi bacterium]|jgi:L-asparaginase II|nr:asparaginase [Chloroflexota bacterium]